MTITKNLKIAILSVAAVMLLMALLVSKAQAYTYTYNTSYSNNDSQKVEAMIARLYQLIAQLEQLKAAQNQNYTYPYTYNYNNGYVLGVSYNNNGNASVSTLPVTNTDNDSTTLNAQVSLNGDSYAYVWFQFGIDGRLNEDSPRVRVTGSNYGNISAQLYNLDRGTTYVYRAVAEAENGSLVYGAKRYFRTENNRSYSSHYGDRPDVYTDSARNVSYNSAKMSGRVDMNDYDSGIVFLVYGESERQVENVDSENRYIDIDENGQSLQKVILDRGLDGYRNYWYEVNGLDRDARHYFRFCVEYDNGSNERLECGDVESFVTDRW